MKLKTTMNLLSLPTYCLTHHTVDVYFTLHTINQKFQRINLVLGAIPLEERHTGEYISRKFDEMLNKWDIERTNIHCVMRDSGANMKKALFLPCRSK